MRNLKTKSDLNLAAAEVLIDKDNNFHASSVHCSYYGCFQYIIYKLDKIGHSKTSIDAAVSSSKYNHSHKYPIKLIIDELKKKVTTDRNYFRDVDNMISDLKVFREDSDYQDIYIDDVMSSKALRMSKEIIRLIETKL